MSIERPRFGQPKSPNELVRQAVGNSRFMGELTEQPLIPPSFRDIISLGTMSETEAKAQFGKKRYGIMVDVTRSDLQGRDLPEEKRHEYSRWLQILNNVDRYITDHHASENGRTLYPKQMEVFEALASFLADGGIEGYFKLPTAFGKTVIFTEFIKATDINSLIVVPTLEILEQTGTTFGRFAPEVEVGKVYLDEKRFGEKTTVITYASLIRYLDERVPLENLSNFRPYDIELLILDEAHHALGEKTALAVSQFPDAIKLGFTATPVYSRERHLGRLLNEPIYSVSIKEAVEEGLLSPFRVWLAQTNVDISKVDVDSITGDYNQRQLSRAVDVASRNKAAVDLYEQHFGNESTLVNCVSVKHAQEVAILFRERGIKAEALWGGLSNKRRSDVVEAYRRGEISVLCSDKVLTEGFDAPGASVCINLKPTLSAVVAEQRGGRVLRLDPANPDKEATIIDFVDKRWGLYQQVSFAEVAETAGIPRKLQDQTGAVSFIGDRYNVQGRRSPTPIFDLGDIKVVTDIIEVMRISSEAQQAREKIGIPVGFLILPTLDIAVEYGVSRVTVMNRIRTLRKLHPAHFQGGAKQQAYFVTEEGLTLLRENLSDLVPLSEFIPFRSGAIAREYGIKAITARVHMMRIRELHPEHFRRRARRTVYMTPHGETLLREDLSQFLTPPGYTVMRDAVKDMLVERSITYKELYTLVTKLSEADPKDFLRRGKAKPILITRRGLELLGNERK